VAHDEALVVLEALRARGREELALGVQLVHLGHVGFVVCLGRLALRVEKAQDALGRLLEQFDGGLVVGELDVLPRHTLLDVHLLLGLEDAGEEELL